MFVAYYIKRSSPLISAWSLSSEGLCSSHLALLRQLTSALFPTAPARLCEWDSHRLARKLMNHYCVLKKDSRYDSDLIFRFAEIELTSFFIIPCVIFIYYIIFAV